MGWHIISDSVTFSVWLLILSDRTLSYSYLKYVVPSNILSVKGLL